MDLETYKCEPIILRNTYDAFCFESIGPKGGIQKVIYFYPIILIGNSYVNLSFGDWDEKTKEVNDESISNNGDTSKILATVAFTALQYARQHDRKPIFVMGTCRARTRLYQMALNAHRLLVESLFVVSGLIAGEWQEFVPGRNYTAFMFSIR
ncbi:hypothetical protein WJU16_18290 [Chitinophaga pollutisoli]|uniref:Uncharacterized protein n=1 Tax=Chitinophaga pollutisoli TaxID=3133966 RepID=A0ABZ2YJM3_9BACT